jgi:hypothetical protein
MAIGEKFSSDIPATASIILLNEFELKGKDMSAIKTIMNPLDSAPI